MEDVRIEKTDGILGQKIVHFFNLAYSLVAEGRTETAIREIGNEELKYQIQKTGLVEKYAKEADMTCDEAQRIVIRAMSCAYKSGVDFFSGKLAVTKELVSGYIS